MHGPGADLNSFSGCGRGNSRAVADKNVELSLCTDGKADFSKDISKTDFVLYCPGPGHPESFPVQVLSEANDFLSF